MVYSRDDDADAADLTELRERARRQQAAAAVRRPKRIADVIAQVLAHGGYAQLRSTDELAHAWRQAAGAASDRYSRVGSLRRGVLSIVVTHSAYVQELRLRKHELLAELNNRLPNHNIRDLRLRTGNIQ